MPVNPDIPDQPVAGLRERDAFFQAALDKVAESLPRPPHGLGAAVARLVGTTRQNTHRVLSQGHRCPASWAIPLARATGIARSRLRPDLYPPSEDPDLKPTRERPASPVRLEREGQLCLPGTERKRPHV